MKRQRAPSKRLHYELRKSTKKLLPAREMAQKPPFVQEKSRQDSPTDGISAPQTAISSFLAPFSPPEFQHKIFTKQQEQAAPYDERNRKASADADGEGYQQE
jgi:hypothetical protein